MTRNVLFSVMIWMALVAPSLAAEAPPALVPQPRNLERLEGEFALTRDSALTVPDASLPDDQNTMNLLRRRIGEITQPAFPLPTSSDSSGASRIVLGIIGRDKSISEEVEKWPKDRQPQTDEGYVIEVTPKRALLAGKSGAGLFYAAQTFLQLVRSGEKNTLTVPAVRIVDWPESGFRGVMIDSSQGPVPKAETVKRIISSIAEFKLNRYYLYAEAAIEYPNLPLVGEPGGRYTPDEIRDIVAWGAQNYVEVVPCVQFHGHLHTALRMEKFSDLAEIPHGGELTPGPEAVDAFIEQCVKTLVELFPSKYIHVGGDETYELGTGRSAQRFPNQPKGEIYLEHALHIHKIIREHGRIPEVWGDIVLNHPDIIPRIPKDTRIMSWSYFERKDDFSPLVEPFAKANLPFVVCPGIRNWMQIYPNFKSMRTVVQQFLKRGRAGGTAGILNTLWSDTCEEFFSLNYYGFAYGGAAGWQTQAVDEVAFDPAFMKVFHRDESGEILQAYRELLESQVIAESLESGSSILLHWLDPFVESTQKRIVAWEPKLRELRLHAENALEHLYRGKQNPLRNRDLLDYLEYAARRLDFAGLKQLYGPEMSRIYRAARDSKKPEPVELAAVQLGASTKANNCRVYDLIYTTANLKSIYRDLWLRENNPYNLEGTLALWDREIRKYWDLHDALYRAWDEYGKTKNLPPSETLGFYVD